MSSLQNNYALFLIKSLLQRKKCLVVCIDHSKHLLDEKQDGNMYKL